MPKISLCQGYYTHYHHHISTYLAGYILGYVANIHPAILTHIVRSASDFVLENLEKLGIRG